MFRKAFTIRMERQYLRQVFIWLSCASVWAFRALKNIGYGKGDLTHPIFHLNTDLEFIK